MIDYKYGVRLAAINSFEAPLLQRWRNDYRVWKWSRQSGLISDTMQSRWIANQDVDKSMHMFMVEDYSGFKIGVCGFTGHDPINRTAELSIYISPDKQKKGSGEAAFKTLMNHGFKNLGLHTIWCEVFSTNKHVIKLVKKVGFKLYGIKKECYFREGKFVDANQFTILEKNWVG